MCETPIVNFSPVRDNHFLWFDFDFENPILNKCVLSVQAMGHTVVPKDDLSDFLAELEDNRLPTCIVTNSFLYESIKEAALSNELVEAVFVICHDSSSIEPEQNDTIPKIKYTTYDALLGYLSPEPSPTSTSTTTNIITPPITENTVTNTTISSLLPGSGLEITRVSRFVQVLTPRDQGSERQSDPVTCYHQRNRWLDSLKNHDYRLAGVDYPESDYRQDVRHFKNYLRLKGYGPEKIDKVTQYFPADLRFHNLSQMPFVKSYTNSGPLSGMFNEIFRTPQKKSHLEDSLKFLYHGLYTELMLNPLAEQLKVNDTAVLYRGAVMSNHDLDTYRGLAFEQSSVNRTFAWSGFVSTTKNVNIAHKFTNFQEQAVLFEIWICRHPELNTDSTLWHMAYDIAEYSVHPHEEEVLLVEPEFYIVDIDDSSRSPKITLILKEASSYVDMTEDNLLVYQELMRKYKKKLRKQQKKRSQ